MRPQERWLAALIALAGLASLGFIAVYFYTKSRLYEGLALSVTAIAFCGVALGWFAWILPHDQVVDQRDEYPSGSEERMKQREEVERVESEVTRSSVLVRLLGGALGLFGLAMIVPIRSLGPAPQRYSEKSKWKPGVRVIREDGTPVAETDLNVNSAITVFPEGALNDYESQTMLIRLPIDSPVGVRGYIAYSKICTHAGCPVALYRARAKQLMCPCHQSVFDVLDDGKVPSGPAYRALPELPLEIGEDNYIRAAGDYDAPIGPGSWDTTS